MSPKLHDGFVRSPLHLLHRVQQLSEILFDVEVGDSGLTPRQLTVLSVVAENDGLSQTGIVESTGIDRSTMADMVRRLTKKGLLQRRRSKTDARAYNISLTEDGQELLRIVRPLAKKVDQRIVQAMGSRNDDFLRRLQEMIAKLQPDARPTG